LEWSVVVAVIVMGVVEAAVDEVVAVVAVRYGVVPAPGTVCVPVLVAARGVRVLREVVSSDREPVLVDVVFVRVVETAVVQVVDVALMAHGHMAAARPVVVVVIRVDGMVIAHGAGP
jgi:hypothetical protein